MSKRKKYSSRRRSILIILCSILLVAGAVLVYLIWVPPLSPPCTDQGEVCDLSRAPFRDASLPVEERVADLVSRMTLNEKIGQLVLVDKRKIILKEDISRYGFGALLSGAGANPDPNTPADWLAMVNDFQSYAQHTRLQIPLLYGVDAVHGHGNIPGATIFPHQIGLGATRDAELVKKINVATAEELAATGVYWNFHPTLDVALDPRWGRTYESFGQDAKNVEALGQASIEGLQQRSSTGMISVLATAKHYVGNGAMAWGTSINPDYDIDQGETRIDEQELRSVHLPPFKKAIESGAMSIMVGLNSWNGQKLTANRYLLTDVLKHELGFKGFVVSDWYGVYEIPGSNYQSAVIALNAGVDMVMLPSEYHFFTRDIRRAINNGEISQDRLDDAVTRILRAKFSLGLFDRPLQDDSELSVIGSEPHRQLAREAVRKSLVLLKNQDDIVPLAKDIPVLLVAGTAADNVGMQAGAWTVEWQGIDGNWLPGSTSIVQGIREALPPGTKVDFDWWGKFSLAKKAPVGIAVVGEKPYAEGFGDSADLRLSDEDLGIIRRVRAASDKIIVIIVSGRPLDIGKEAKNWDAVIAAWLPGSEGKGVADVLFGDYPFSGRLPLPWDL